MSELIVSIWAVWTHQASYPSSRQPEADPIWRDVYISISCKKLTEYNTSITSPFILLSFFLFLLSLQHADHLQHQPGWWSDISVYRGEQRRLVSGQCPSHSPVGRWVTGHPDWSACWRPLANVHTGVVERTSPEHTGHHRLRVAHPQDSRYKARNNVPSVQYSLWNASWCSAAMLPTQLLECSYMVATVFQIVAMVLLCGCYAGRW